MRSGVVMPMTGWCTVGARKRRLLSKQRFKPGWQNATWNCIQAKTKIVYCLTGNRRRNYPNVSFDFLGYCFRPRKIKRSQEDTFFCGFAPAVSNSAMRAMRATIRQLNIRRQTQRSLNDIARLLNPLIRGWLAYYGRFSRSALYPVLRDVNLILMAWAMWKFKRFRKHKLRTGRFFERLSKERPDLFAHWSVGMIGAFA